MLLPFGCSHGGRQVLALQISEVLSVHNSYQASESGYSHADILGDAFLLQHNPVYKNIKTCALKFGCKYVEAWPEYLLMPFHQLGGIVARKTIPYVPSGRLLREVEGQRAGVLSSEDISIPESYHLHEAAHVIAEELFFGYQFEDPQEKILKTIVCESFANTVDAFACASVNSEEHSFFLAHNCYMYPDKENIEYLAQLNESFGQRFAFMLTLVAYIHANFLRETISAPVINELGARYAPRVKAGAEELENCASVMKIAEKLDPLFRVQTTGMYLKLEGYDGDLLDVLDFQFMEVFVANPVFRDVTEAMADVVLG